MMFYMQRRVFMLCFILLLCDDGLSKPSSFLKSIQSLHHSEKSKTRFRRNLLEESGSKVENIDNTNGNNSSGIWEADDPYEQFYTGPGMSLFNNNHGIGY